MNAGIIFQNSIVWIRKDSKCREIFETEIVSMEWCYHITEGESAPDMASLLRKKGISVFEVITRQKISPEPSGVNAENGKQQKRTYCYRHETYG